MMGAECIRAPSIVHETALSRFVATRLEKVSSTQPLYTCVQPIRLVRSIRKLNAKGLSTHYAGSVRVSVLYRLPDA